MCGSDIFLGIIAILFPPLAVWVKKGICSADSLINIALCMLGFVPGLFHAWYIIATNPEPTYDELAQQDPERGNVTYYYVQTHSSSHGGGRQGGQTYGTVNNTPGSQFPIHSEGFVHPQAPPPSQHHQQEASSTEVPPTYQQAVQGDHKVQRS